MFKNEFIDLGFEIWMRLLKNEEPSYVPQSENVENQRPSERSIIPKH